MEGDSGCDKGKAMPISGRKDWEGGAVLVRSLGLWTKRVVKEEIIAIDK